MENVYFAKKSRTSYINRCKKEVNEQGYFNKPKMAKWLSSCLPAGCYVPQSCISFMNIVKKLDKQVKRKKKASNWKKGKRMGLLKSFYPSIIFLCENTAEIREVSINIRVVSSSRLKWVKLLPCTLFSHIHISTYLSYIQEEQHDQEIEDAT